MLNFTLNILKDLILPQRSNLCCLGLHVRDGDAQTMKVYVEDKTHYVVDNMDAAQAEKGLHEDKGLQVLQLPMHAKRNL